jgi:hypothetical protein
MDDTEKLPVLIHHWVEHNNSHKAEFEKWAQRASELGLQDAGNAIRTAAARLEEASACLQQALQDLNTN